MSKKSFGISGPVHVRSSEVPEDLLRAMILMALGEQPSPQEFQRMCEWADPRGGDVVIEFPEDDPLAFRTPVGYQLNSIRFVSPR